MKIRVDRAEFKEVEALRELYRHEANCQIIRDSFLSRGFGDAYLMFLDDRIAGYGAVWNKHHESRLGEFYTFPAFRAHASPMAREVLMVSKARQIEAQSNMPLALTLLYDCAENIVCENILFGDAFTTALTCPNAVFRRSKSDDKTDANWVLEANGAVVASGGVLGHYNPPFGDVYMEVVESQRQQGYGSFLVQELKRVAYEAGKIPAARCNPDNTASRRTLQKAGMLPVGRMLAGDVAASL